jgi:hypothetical protein
MKVYLRIVPLVFTLISYGMTLPAIAAERPLVINVLDYGAKGDGKADDTAAIRAACTAAVQQGVRERSGGITMLAMPTVVFPTGTYLVSETIPLEVTASLRGDRRAFLKATRDDLVMFTSVGWRTRFEGLTFIGGKTHLSFDGQIDQGQIIITDCSFTDSTGPALYIHTRSINAIIEKSHFSNNDQVLITINDMTMMRDCWITTAPTMANKAAIEARGDMMVIEGLCGVPLVGAPGQRWIDNYTGLFLALTQCRIGGEGGGFTCIYNFSKPRSSGGSSILIDNSLLCAMASPKTKYAAVYCEEIPNKIEIRSSILLGASPVSLAPHLDVKNYFTGLEPTMLSYTFRDNVGVYADQIPDFMRNPSKYIKPVKLATLSPKETKRLLKQAVTDFQTKDLPDETVGEANGHRQQTAPGTYIDITPRTHRFNLDDFMDGLRVKNRDYLALTEVGSDVLIMKKIAGMHPHVLIENVAIDLDKTPWLSLKLKGDDPMHPDGYALKVIDRETGGLVKLVEQPWPPFHDYMAYDLRQHFKGATGVRHFDMRLYYLGLRMVSDLEVHTAKPGEYIVLDFLRAEAD